MKKGSNLSMFKSQWDETKAKWGRWDLNPGFRLFRRREGCREGNRRCPS